jgi:hypothetical protein
MTLLPPLEPASNHDKPIVEFIRDHIVYTTARSNMPFITLSGLRGALDSYVFLTHTKLIKF